MGSRPPFTSEMTFRLAAELQRWGICHLTAGDDPDAQAAAAAAPLAPATLLAYLAAEPDARVHAACVPFLLRHPELVAALPEALTQAEALASDAEEALVVLSLAAAYLQQLMRQKLTWVLGPLPELALPPMFWKARHLPPPTPETSEEGLEALNRSQQARQQMALNFQGDWRSAADHLFKQEWLHRTWRLLQAREVPPATPEEALHRKVAEAAEAWVQAQTPGSFALALEISPAPTSPSGSTFLVRVSSEPNVWRHGPPQVFDEQVVEVRVEEGEQFIVSELREPSPQG